MMVEHGPQRRGVVGVDQQRQALVALHAIERGRGERAQIGVELRAVGGEAAIVDAALGVVKAYTTRVGEGPLPTELFGDMGDRLRESGNEYGAVTGRPRRCGWYDAVAARYSVRINGLDALALTKLDVLDNLERLLSEMDR